MLAPGSGTDLAAQLARASFAREAPLTPVDLSWYSGLHVYSYSLLAPWLLAVLGVAVAGLLAAVGGAVLLARLLRDTERPYLGAVLGAVFCVADVVSGRTTFALGAVAALGALVVLPRLRWAALLAVLTALLSPVAAAFLGLAAAVLVLHRRVGGWTIGVATTAPVIGLAVLFPAGGIQPFSGLSARPAVLVALVLAALTSAPMLRTGALLYALAITVLAFHDDPFGSNVLRLGLLVAAPLVVAMSRRSAVVCLVAAVGFVSWQVGPTLGDLQAPRGPQLSALESVLVSRQARRVEVVAARDHRESADLAPVVPLARGWSRQIDRADNALFYEGTLTAGRFRSWLLTHSVDHVAVPRTALLDFGSTREGRLLRAGVVPGLAKVWSDRDWILYAVQDPQPIVELPATVLASLRTTLELGSAVPTRVRVDVRWSRWLSLSGPGCLERDGDRVRVRFSRAGTVTLGSSLLPTGHC